MFKTLNRHLGEIIMILAELLIAILLMLQLPSVVEVITVCVGILSILCGTYCIARYHHTLPAYLRYGPELSRGITLLFVGVAIASMQKWFSVTSSAPAVALGLTLLMFAFFKIAVVWDAKSSKVPYLLFPTLSTLLTFALSLFSLFTPIEYISNRWIIVGSFMLAILLIDAYEIYSSETEKRNPWSMQIRCWM